MQTYDSGFPASKSHISFPAVTRLLMLMLIALGLSAPTLGQNVDGIAPAGAKSQFKQQSESELIVEGLGSFGHFHVFAYSWWSYLDVGGLEYDRHSWGKFLGARRDYVAEVLPIAILRQPAKTDVFGDPLTTAHKNNYGVGISPAGMRLIWRDGKKWKPYYTIKGGLTVFTQKSLSEYASYQNFSLQQSLGIQIKVTPQWDFRVGFSDFHFSNAFMVPSNPGIDEMAYTGGICYHLGGPAK